MSGRVYTAIGLMSGTSLDGIDAALIRTDGRQMVERLGFVSLPYDQDTQEALRSCLGKKEDTDGSIGRVEIELTRAHAAAIDWLLGRTGNNPADIDIIGFHGQTIFHEPEAGFTWQLGNGAMLARLTGIDVINDFRSADVRAGGEGAPLLPLYHQAMARQAGLKLPAAILNIGGVANVTWLGETEDVVLAFDTGPGNALLNDWTQSRIGRPYDEGGMLARQGAVNQELLAKWLDHPYFKRTPPKSLDRDAWTTKGLDGLSAADGAATLTGFTIEAIGKALDYLPASPKAWYVTGGGRYNRFMMEELASRLAVPVKPVEDIGWDGDAVEAEGFAYLAVRSLKNMPLSLPEMTGVPKPQTGGRLFRAGKQSIRA